MQDVFSMMKTVAPDLSDMLQIRYEILFQLAHANHPLGRKSLAQRVRLSERSLRTVIEILKAQGLVEVNRLGISIAPQGRAVFKMLSQGHSVINRLSEVEEALKQVLPIKNVWVVPGDSQADPHVYEVLAQAVESVLMQHLRFGRCTIAVTGGATLARMAEHLTPEISHHREIVFVPARGGVRGRFDIQSNTVGSLMAEQTGSQYVPLFLPDMIEEDASKILLANPSVSQAVKLGKQADCLLVSVGSAQTMAERRELTSQQQRLVQAQQAVGEVFGIFYDEQGKEVLRLPRIGIQLEEVTRIPLVLTIVSGAAKAAAVKGYCQLIPNHGWMICDEGIAQMILNEATH